MTAPLIDLFDEMAEKILDVVGPAAPGQPEFQVVLFRNPYPTPPSIDIFPADTAREDDTRGFQEHGGTHMVTVRFRFTSVDEIAGHELLYRVMDEEDDISIVAALEDDQTLNGLASSVVCVQSSGMREYPERGGSHLGCDWLFKVVRVLS